MKTMNSLIWLKPLFISSKILYSTIYVTNNSIHIECNGTGLKCRLKYWERHKASSELIQAYEHLSTSSKISRSLRNNGIINNEAQGQRRLLSGVGDKTVFAYPLLTWIAAQNESLEHLLLTAPLALQKAKNELHASTCGFESHWVNCSNDAIRAFAS